jgi:hypothetical protein
MSRTDQNNAQQPEASAQAFTDGRELDIHFQKVVRKMMNGLVVPLLGAGVNFSGRPKDKDFKWDEKKHQYLPNGSELAAWLAEQFEYYPDLKKIKELDRVSQFLELKEGGELYQSLHDLFDADYPPSPLHTFLAEAHQHLREQGRGAQVILTTNYDDALERAFAKAGEEYDLITYVCTSPIDFRGKFMHFRPGSDEPVPIIEPNAYEGLDLSKRSVILKMHGAVRRRRSFEEDNYVITEDHYIDYLTHTDISGLLPKPIPEKLRNSHFLFLGYGMRDWNLRVILRRIWGEQPVDYPSWSIQLDPDELERAFWANRKVDILELDLDDYVARLREAFDERLAKHAASP